MKFSFRSATESRQSRGRGEEGEGPGRSGAQGREVYRSGPPDSRMPRPQRTMATWARSNAANCGQGDRRRRIQAEQGLRDRSRSGRPNGFEILRVEERFAAGQASFEEVRTRSGASLSSRRCSPRFAGYLTQLRQNAFLQIKPGYVDSGGRAGQRHVVAGSRATEAGDHHEGGRGRPRTQEIPARGIPYGRDGQ